MESQNKVAVITGAGSGIGKAVALAFLKDGWCVSLAGRRADMLEKTVAESGAGKHAAAIPTDVSKPDAVKLWQATNAETRDFRLMTIGPAYQSSDLEDQGGGKYVAHVRAPALPAGASGLAARHVHMIDVANLTDRRETRFVDPANFARRESHQRVTGFAVAEGGLLSGATRDLTAATWSDLNVMNT